MLRWAGLVVEETPEPNLFPRQPSTNRLAPRALSFATPPECPSNGVAVTDEKESRLRVQHHLSVGVTTSSTPGKARKQHDGRSMGAAMAAESPATPERDADLKQMLAAKQISLDECVTTHCR